MVQAILDAVVVWNKRHDDRAKLQYVYAISAIILLVIAGLLGLVNTTISSYLLQATFFLAGLFFVNAVAWALTKSFIIDKLPRNQKRK